MDGCVSRAPGERRAQRTRGQRRPCSCGSSFRWRAFQWFPPRTVAVAVPLPLAPKLPVEPLAAGGQATAAPNGAKCAIDALLHWLWARTKYTRSFVARDGWLWVASAADALTRTSASAAIVF